MRHVWSPLSETMHTKSGDEKRAGPSPSRPTQRRGFFFWVCAITFAAIIFIFTLSTQNGVGNRLKLWLAEETPRLGWHRSRAEGDEYLLGVGKADITGYVNIK